MKYLSNLHRKIIIILLTIVTFPLFGNVTIVNRELPLDGKVWNNIPLRGNFKYLAASGKSTPKAQTSFQVAASATSLYINVICKEDNMAKLRKSQDLSKLWGSDTIEIFIAPTGQIDEFYQFAVSAGNLKFSTFYGEGGAIQPDNYLPFWSSKVFYYKNYWQLQIKIPFSAFYMTRNAKWNNVWLFNVARNRYPVRERSTWSNLKSSFKESSNFNKLSGFPKRASSLDIVINKATPTIKSFSKGIYSGPLALVIQANSAAIGVYNLTIEEKNGKKSTHVIELNNSINNIVLPKVEYLNKTKGKNTLKFTLNKVNKNISLGRYYPVEITYQPLKITLSSPGYKNNFYPGQDTSKITGFLKVNLPSEQKSNTKVTITLSSKSLLTKTLTFNANKENIFFTFDSKKLPKGEAALLTAKIINNNKVISTKTCQIKNLKPNKGSAIWIENNVLIKNGKPWYPRTIYARGYLGGTVFKEFYEKDNLSETPVKRRNVSPGKLIANLEGKEATKDVKPCKELFDKIRKIVNKSKNDPDFAFYYIADEPEYRNISPVYLKYIYNFVSELDPYHPLLTCTTAADKYLEIADVFTPHPYLNPIISEGKRILAIPVNRVKTYLQYVTNSKRKDKVVGFTGQFFSYKFSNIFADYPTWDELTSSSWSAIANGSRFHFPYAYHDLGDRPHIYEGYRYFNESIKALEKLLLSNKKHSVKVENANDNIDTLLVEDNHITLLIIVNLNNSPANPTIIAPHLKKYQSLLKFRSNGSIKVTNGKIQLALKPYESLILTSKKLDKNLLTTSQVLDKIAKLEHQRSSRGNLLFEKGNTFEVNSSNPISFNNSFLSILQQKNKLFDGTTNILAWQSKPFSKNNFYELNFRRRPPKFSKVKLYGLYMGTPKVKIWKFGEWKELKEKKITKTKDFCLLDFGEENKSVKVHIYFPKKIGKNPIELYEIELLK